MALAMMVKPGEVLSVGSRLRVWLAYDKHDARSPVKLGIAMMSGEVLNFSRPLTVQKIAEALVYMLCEPPAGELVLVGGVKVGWSRDQTTYAGTPRIIVEGSRERFPVDRTQEVAA